MQKNGGISIISYRRATLEDLERVWDYNMSMDPEEPRMQRRKESYIRRNVEGRATTYVVIADGEPVGEVTLDYFAEAYGNPNLRDRLAAAERQAISLPCGSAKPTKEKAAFPVS